MKKLLKGVMGITSIAVMAAGAYYLTKKLLGEPAEELDDEYEDFDFDDDDEEETDDKSREYVTLDFDEDGEDVSDDKEAGEGEEE